MENKKYQTTINKLLPEVKQQHQVWRYYLNAWSFVDEKVFCLDKTVKNIFTPSTNNIAKENYAYEQPRFIDDELAFFLAHIASIHNDSIREASLEDISLVLFPASLERLASKFNTRDFDNDLEYARKNLLERWHGTWENACKPIIDKLRTGNDVKDLPSSSERYLFNFFLSDQCMRTSKIRSIIDSQKGENDFKKVIGPDGKEYKIRSSSFQYFLSYHLVTVLAQMLTYEEYKYHVLSTDYSSSSFLTSDQPAFFVQKNSNGDMALYYPLSPTKCLRMDQDGDDSFEIANESIVSFINSETIKAANRFLISNEKGSLEIILGSLSAI